MTYPDDDDQFLEHKIMEVTPLDDSFSIKMDDSFMFWVPKDAGVVPEVGNTIRLYGKGFGYDVRGMFIEGQEVYYRTEDGQEELRRKQAAEIAEERREDFKKKAAEYEARIRALPGPFQDRIAGFRERQPKFNVDSLGYELFGCEQAVVIGLALKTPEQIKAFSKEDWKVQKEMVPGLSDDHSGNTMGFAMQMATFFVSDLNDVIAKMHGAMCPLVGCEAYGCYAVGDEAKAQED